MVNRDPLEVGIFPCRVFGIMVSVILVSFHMRKTCERNKALVYYAQDISIHERLWGPCMATWHSSVSSSRQSYGQLMLPFFSSVCDVSVGFSGVKS